MELNQQKFRIGHTFEIFTLSLVLLSNLLNSLFIMFFIVLNNNVFDQKKSSILYIFYDIKN
jgi:hypothetical protein